MGILHYMSLTNLANQSDRQQLVHRQNTRFGISFPGESDSRLRTFVLQIWSWFQKCYNPSSNIFYIQIKYSESFKNKVVKASKYNLSKYLESTFQVVFYSVCPLGGEQTRQPWWWTRLDQDL